MVNFLQSLLWALIVICTFFGAIEIQKQVTADIEKRADANEFNGWCNVNFKNSNATVDCRNVSRLDQSMARIIRKYRLFRKYKLSRIESFKLAVGFYQE